MNPVMSSWRPMTEGSNDMQRQDSFVCCSSSWAVEAVSAVEFKTVTREGRICVYPSLKMPTTKPTDVPCDRTARAKESVLGCN